MKSLVGVPVLKAVQLSGNFIQFMRSFLSDTLGQVDRAFGDDDECRETKGACPIRLRQRRPTAKSPFPPTTHQK